MTRRQEFSNIPTPGPLILGATGRVGQTLAHGWPPSAGAGIWQYRPSCNPAQLAAFPGPALAWDILATPPPMFPENISGLIILAAVIAQDQAALRQNTDIALAAVEAAQAAGITRILVASTQAVYGTDQARVDESTPCRPTSPYGQAKLQMEQALKNVPGVTCLRLGNIAGADSLFGAAHSSAHSTPIILDRFPDGRSPRRSYIGPVTLARVLNDLLNPALSLPPILNVASPGIVSMDAILMAAKVPFDWREAPSTALPELEIDVNRLKDLIPMAPARAADIVAEASACGWVAPNIGAYGPKI